MDPPGDRSVLLFDVELGRDYGVLTSSKAWEHFVGELCWLRELMVQRLVKEKGDQAEARATVKLAEQMLMIPDVMIERGHESEQGLKRMVSEGIEE